METATTLSNNSLTQLNRILSEIQDLDTQEKLHLYRELQKGIRREEDALQRAMKYRGVAKHYWGDDAQDYISQMRSDDRL